MKFIHLSDLHLGKRVNEFSMLEDQRYILRQILDIVRAEAPDVVILATGANELRPPIRGSDGANVVSVVDVDRGNAKVGQKVVVCGAGMSGSECAMGLGKEGKQVTVVDMRPQDQLYKNLKDFTLPIFLKLLRDNGVDTRYETAVQEITDKGVLVKGPDGKEELLEADTVILAFGLKADQAELEALSSVVPETYIIGDAHKIGIIGDATNDAYRICLEIQ